MRRSVPANSRFEVARATITFDVAHRHMLSRVVFAPTGDNDDTNRNREVVQYGWSRNPRVEVGRPIPPLVARCVQRDFGDVAECVWVLARSESEARGRAEPLLRNLFPTSAPVARVEAFPRAEYRDRWDPGTSPPA